MRVGIAHHLGWAVAVAADDAHRVLDRRRIELIEPGLPPAPVHHEGGPHDLHRSGPPLSDDELRALVARVRASVEEATAAALGALGDDLAEPVASISIRDWPTDLPSEIGDLRRPPYEARADSAMYCQILADAAADLGWPVHRFSASRVEAEATELLGRRANEVLHGPRAVLGAPWTKDHRMALAATVLAAADT